MAFLVRSMVLGLTVVVAIALRATTLCAAEPAALVETADGPLAFRKVFVPADKVDQWPRGATRYVPVKADEFQRLVSAAAERSENAGAPPAGRLKDARYSAQLTDDGMLKGELQIDVGHDAKDVMLVPLTPCGIAMSEPQWIEDKKPRPAVLGVDQEGVLRLVVAQQGTLRASWALRGKREASGELSFILALPAIPKSRLQLDLPRAVTPWVELGAVAEVPGGAVGNRRWQIDLGSRTSTRLLISAVDGATAPPTAVVRQNMVYDFSTRGVELTARLTLDIGPRAMDHLLMELATGLQLLDVRMGDAALTWSQRTTGPGKPAQIALEFPEPLTGAQRVVQLRAVAPLRLGQRHALPTLTPLDVFWQEATSTLLVPKPLTLGELDLAGCRQSKVEPLVGAEGEALTFQGYTPDARIELRVDRLDPPLSIAAATSLELGPRETRGRWVGDCTVAQSERFSLDAVVATGWQIDQVETEPVGGIEHWSTVKHAGEDRLLVRLARAATPKRPLRVIVSGRLAESALARPLANDTLRMIDVEESAWRQRLIGLTASKPHQLRVTGDEELTRVDPEKLDEAGRARLGGAPPDLVYRDDNGADRMRAALARQAAGHVADIHVTLHVRGGLLEESARIAVRPDSGGIERLLVHASQLREQPFIWSVGDDAAARLGARRLSDIQQREAGYSSGETWEIVLDHPRTAPWDLVARRTLPFPSGTEATLLTVSPVAEQHGMVTVRSDAGEALQIHNLRLQSIPTESAAADTLATARASYRYDPERDAVLPQSMLLLSRPQAGTLLPGAVVWKGQYDARCHADGRTTHRAVLCVENRGRRQIRVDLPPEAVLEQVSVDGMAGRRVGDAEQHGAIVELAADKRFPTIELNYTSRHSVGGSWRRLTPLLPSVDVEVLRWEAVVWTPPGERVVWAEGIKVPAAGWLARLFGPLARTAGERPFNPLSDTDWRGLVDPPEPKSNTGPKGTEPTGDTSPKRERGTHATLPWVSDSDEDSAAGAWQGWTANRVELGGRALPAVVVMHEPLWFAAGWSIVLLTLLSLWWLYPRSVRAWAILVLPLALAALLAPTFVAPIATALLLGTLGAALLTLLAPGGPSFLSATDVPAGESWTADRNAALPSTFSQPGPGSSLRRSLLALAVILSASAPRVPTQAGDPPALPRGPAVIYTVLVPIDKDRQPSGDTWYVPLDLYRALSARAAAKSVERHGWLTTGVNYLGRMELSGAPTRVHMTELTATFDVEAYGRQTQIRFPLTRDSVTILPSGALLDGRSVETVWDERGQGLLVDVAEPGRHRVELSLKPALREAEGGEVDLATPALPTARLQLNIPTPAPEVNVVSALGAVETDVEIQRFTAQLGGTDKLTLRWPPPASGGAPPQPDIDQLLWLKIAPGAVTLEARLMPQGFEGRVPRLVLRVDPSLRVLEAAGAAPIQMRVTPGSPQTVVLESDRGFAADEEVTLSLLWAEASGLGRMRLPLLSVAQGRPPRAWLVVTVNKSLAFETPRDAELPIATVADLPLRWQPTGAVADLIYRLPRGDSSWTIATQPRPPESTAEQTLALSLSADSAEVRYVAQIDTTSGSLFAHRLRVPKELTISRVELTQDQEQDDRVARWTASNGMLTVLLNRPVTGRQRLAVRGTWPLEEQNVPVPNFQLEDCRQQNLDLAIYRRVGVDVQPTDAEAVHELVEPTTEMLRLAEKAPRWFGRQVGLYRVVNPQAMSIFRVRPVPPEFDAMQTTTLSRKDGVWQAEVDYRLHVRAGAVDSIRFLLPASLRGPLTITPEEPFAVVDIPGQRQRQLVIRPREAVRDRLRLTFSGPLVSAAGERFAAPLIEPLDAAHLTHFVVLPQQVEQERVQWELRGLERQPMPPDDSMPATAAASVNAYRVMGRRFQAALASVAKIERAPRIRLADIRVALDGAGQGSGVACFDLEPAGLGQCVLTTPPGVRPVQATVGALPAALVALDENRWEMSLNSNQLPQRVEILFQGKIAEKSSGPLAAPWLAARSGPLEVVETLWTVFAPRGASLLARSPGAPVSAIDQQWQRLESLSAMLGETSADESADILARWYEPWANDLSDTWRTTATLRLAAGADDDAGTVRMQENRLKNEQIATRLRTLEVLERVEHATVSARPGAMLWRGALPESAASAPLRISAAGGLPELTIESRTVLSRDLTGRLLLGALVVGALGLLVWSPSSRRIAATVHRWPYGVAALAALMGWLLLSPGAWALALAAGIAAASWRRPGTAS